MQIINKSVGRGDTLIEVLFAVAVFSLVAVGSLSIMNQGTATAQRALEISLVREEVDAQAETLRFLNASYISSPNSTQATQWKSIAANLINPNASPYNATGTCPSSPINRSFILDPKTAKVVPLVNSNYQQASTFSQVRYNGSNFNHADGIWVEAVRTRVADNHQGNAGYIDFHIRACWDSPGQSVPAALGTIVRLYEPL